MPESSKIIIRQLIKEDIRRSKHPQVITNGTIRFRTTNAVNAGDVISFNAAGNNTLGIATTGASAGQDVNLVVQGNATISGDLSVQGRVTSAQ